MNPRLRLHHLDYGSRVNGPGRRCVIWTQGCSFNCPGCFNPETHTYKAAFETGIRELAADILSNQNQIEGLTISGGEPVLQWEPLRDLLSILKSSSDMGVILLTGFEWSSLLQIPGFNAFLNQVDLVLAGRYLDSRRQADHLVGSSNKTVHFLTTRYQWSDLEIPPAEVLISGDGQIVLSGIDPLIW